MIRSRHPEVAFATVRSLHAGGSLTLAAAARAAHALTVVQGFEPLPWEDLAEFARPPFHGVVEQEPGVWLATLNENTVKCG